MTDEDTTNTDNSNTEPQDTPNEPENKPKDVLQEAKEVRDSIKEERLLLEKANEERRQLMAKEMLNGETGTTPHQQLAQETDADYRKRVEKEISEGKYD